MFIIYNIGGSSAVDTTTNQTLDFQVQHGVVATTTTTMTSMASSAIVN